MQTMLPAHLKQPSMFLSNITSKYLVSRVEMKYLNTPPNAGLLSFIGRDFFNIIFMHTLNDDLHVHYCCVKKQL